MNLGERFVFYLMLSLLFSIMNGGAAGIVMLWGHYIWEVMKDAERKERRRKYIEEYRRKHGYNPPGV